MNNLLLGFQLLVPCFLLGIVGVAIFEYGRKNQFHPLSLGIVFVITLASLIAGVVLPVRLVLNQGDQAASQSGRQQSQQPDSPSR
jgi:hypothetical protein